MGVQHASYFRGIRVARPEEGVREGDGVNAGHGLVLQERRINEEKDWHVNLLARLEKLFFEAKALDLVEVECSPLQGHTFTVQYSPQQLQKPEEPATRAPSRFRIAWERK